MSRPSSSRLTCSPAHPLLPALLVLSLFLPGCASVRLGTLAGVAAGSFVAYRVLPNLGWQHRYRDALASTAPDSAYALHFVEIDDNGTFYDPRQADAALETVRAKLEKRNVIVVLFVHGWHNNAKYGNHDVNAIRAVLHGTEQQLRQYAPNTSLVGIFVGWRGRALPWLLDYSTFYGRKNAAQRVGRGDLRTLLHRLQRIYSDHAVPTDRIHHLGLVTIGHSFGGQALFEATRYALEQQLYYRADSTRLASAPPLDPIVHGIGDVTFLINPAVEAGAFDLIDRGYRGHSYASWQTPVYVVIDGQGDKARRLWFPFGRAFGLFGMNLHGDKRKEALSALGVYNGQVTHDLRLVRPGFYPRPAAGGPRDVVGNGFEGVVEPELQTLSQAAASVPYTDDTVQPDSLTSVDYLAGLDLGGPLRIAGDSLSVRGPTPAHSPVLVIRTDTKVTGGHSDVFRPELAVFLTRYIRAIEAKASANARTRSIRAGNRPMKD